MTVTDAECDCGSSSIGKDTTNLTTARFVTAQGLSRNKAEIAAYRPKNLRFWIHLLSGTAFLRLPLESGVPAETVADGPPGQIFLISETHNLIPAKHPPPAWVVPRSSRQLGPLECLKACGLLYFARPCQRKGPLMPWLDKEDEKWLDEQLLKEFRRPPLYGVRRAGFKGIVSIVVMALLLGLILPPIFQFVGIPRYWAYYVATALVVLRWLGMTKNPGPPS